MHTLHLFCKIVKFRFFALIEYPGAYIAGITAQWMSYGIEMLMIFLMVWQFGALAGWLPAEVVFNYALWLMTYAIAASFTFSLTGTFSQMAINGTLDEALVRPMPPLIYLIASNYNLGYISHVTLTTAALIWSIVNLGMVWSALQWVWLVVLIISGAAITGCMMMLCEMPSLRTRSRSPTGVFFWNIRSFSQYPISIYPRPVQFALTAVLPYGFISFYPVQVLLGKNDGLFAEVAKWLSPAVAILLLYLTWLAWRQITRRYESAGT